MPIGQKSTGHAQGYDRFSVFQDNGRSPSWVFKSWKFYLLSRFRGLMCVVVPNCAPIGQTIPEIWPYFDFSKCQPSMHHLCFLKVRHFNRRYGA